jgi:hypothetical protein
MGGGKKFGQGPAKREPGAGETRSAPVISMVKSAARTNRTDIHARLVLINIRLGTWRKLVGQIRGTFDETRKKTGDCKTAKKSVDRLKRDLPAIMWSGRFSRRANAALAAEREKTETLAKAIEEVLADEESGEGWGPDVTTVGKLKTAMQKVKEEE